MCSNTLRASSIAMNWGVGSSAGDNAAPGDHHPSDGPCGRVLADADGAATAALLDGVNRRQLVEAHGGELGERRRALNQNALVGHRIGDAAAGPGIYHKATDEQVQPGKHERDSPQAQEGWSVGGGHRHRFQKTQIPRKNRLNGTNNRSLLVNSKPWAG
jgi:hypothetical protein